jgi:hypothetical protein
MAHTTFTDVFPSPIFFPTVFVASSAIIIPYYFMKSMREVIYFPRLFTFEGIKSFIEQMK